MAGDRALSGPILGKWPAPGETRFPAVCALSRACARPSSRVTKMTVPWYFSIASLRAEMLSRSRWPGAGP